MAQRFTINDYLSQTKSEIERSYYLRANADGDPCNCADCREIRNDYAKWCNEHLEKLSDQIDKAFELLQKCFCRCGRCLWCGCIGEHVENCPYLLWQVELNIEKEQGSNTQ